MVIGAALRAELPPRREPHPAPATPGARGLRGLAAVAGGARPRPGRQRRGGQLCPSTVSTPGSSGTRSEQAGPAASPCTTRAATSGRVGLQLPDPDVGATDRRLARVTPTTGARSRFPWRTSSTWAGTCGSRSSTATPAWEEPQGSPVPAWGPTGDPHGGPVRRLARRHVAASARPARSAGRVPGHPSHQARLRTLRRGAAARRRPASGLSTVPDLGAGADATAAPRRRAGGLPRPAGGRAAVRPEHRGGMALGRADEPP